ncbi:MAG: hypothetical protein ABFD25_15925 [Clostridiaceae bacterium]
MISEFIKRSKTGECVYITEVRKAFDKASQTKDVICVLELVKKGEIKDYTIRLPDLEGTSIQETKFIKRYFYARIYNILSTLGGKKMTLYIDTADEYLMQLVKTLDEVFCINSEKAKRKGYGRCINVIDRMAENLCGSSFSFEIKDVRQLGKCMQENEKVNVPALEVFKKAAKGLAGKTICGMDVGGTDIKIAIAVNGRINCFKEYDWFPAKFTKIEQLIEPIRILVRLVRAKIAFDNYKREKPVRIVNALEKAMSKEADNEDILIAVECIEELLCNDMQPFDGIGLCFPDVVVQDKIVGGEVYKTRGIRDNKEIDYEKEFKKLTSLDSLLLKYCKPNGAVKIINDGPMAAFTAAVEMAASANAGEVKAGVFAHTLGTELGTGWVDDNGDIPEIPLEVYNYIIDLGSNPEREFAADDIRSINNFNTGLAGTLQKYTSQSGVFRLAVKYFKESRKDLYEQLFKKGFIIETCMGGKEGLYLNTEPVDLRKPFLEYIMDLAENEDCETCRRIFREIGEYLAVTWEETENILHPKVKNRVLFGRLVKKQSCFDLMKEGARRIAPDMNMSVADGEMANTELMKQLTDNKKYTVAQFAQAVGAIYYANLYL